jgi:hypothetical protein
VCCIGEIHFGKLRSGCFAGIVAGEKRRERRKRPGTYISVISEGY